MISMPQKVGTKVHVITRDRRIFDNATVISDEGLDLTLFAMERYHPRYIQINWREVWFLYHSGERLSSLRITQRQKCFLFSPIPNP